MSLTFYFQPDRIAFCFLFLQLTPPVVAIITRHPHNRQGVLLRVRELVVRACPTEHQIVFGRGVDDDWIASRRALTQSHQQSRPLEELDVVVQTDGVEQSAREVEAVPHLNDLSRSI